MYMYTTTFPSGERERERGKEQGSERVRGREGGREEGMERETERERERAGGWKDGGTCFITTIAYGIKNLIAIAGELSHYEVLGISITNLVVARD